MSTPTPPTYRTKNWPAYNEALKRRGSLTVWFDPEMNWDAVPTGRRGRQQSYSDAAIQTCLSMKVLFGMALRQTTGFVESLLRLVGLDWTVARLQHAVAPSEDAGRQYPVSRLQGSVAPAYRQHRDQGRGRRRMARPQAWRPQTAGLAQDPNLGIDEETLEIRAVEITGSHIGDAPVLPDLLSQIPIGEELGSVTADGAYDTRKCHDAIADRGAHAVIPPRKNAKPWQTVTAGAVARNEALRASEYLGRALWRRWSGYHRRSRVETKMHCVKLLGQRLMARDFDRQVAEIQVRIAVLNGYAALGIPVTEAVG